MNTQELAVAAIREVAEALHLDDACKRYGCDRAARNAYADELASEISRHHEDFAKIRSIAADLERGGEEARQIARLLRGVVG